MTALWAAASLTLPRSAATASALSAPSVRISAPPDGSVLIVGGELFNPAVDEVGRASAAVHRFDPATLQFTPLPGLLVPRTLMTGVALADDRVLMFGGIAGDESFLGAGEVYRPGRAPLPAASLPVARAWHTVSRLPGGQVLIVGGLTPTGETASNVLIYQ